MKPPSNPTNNQNPLELATRIVDFEFFNPANRHMNRQTLIEQYAAEIETAKQSWIREARLHELKAIRDSEIANRSMKQIQLRINGRIAELETLSPREEKTS